MDEDNITVSASDDKQNLSNAAMVKEAFKGLDTPYDIHVHSILARLGDVDGRSAKAAIDGLVQAGILKDDSPSYIKSIKFTVLD